MRSILPSLARGGRGGRTAPGKQFYDILPIQESHGTCHRSFTLTRAQTLQSLLVSVAADASFSEAVLCLRDGSRLCFCHRVGERWAKAVGPEQRENDPGLAGALLAAITMFRLNAKHLDIQFTDGSRWDEKLQSLDSTSP